MTEALSTVEYLSKLTESAPEDVLKIQTGMAYAEERKYVSVQIPEKLGFDRIEIYHLTDVQWGHVCCQENRFIEYRDFILAEPNRFTVFGGDMINAATMLSKGTPWEDNSLPIEQVYRFVQVSMPMRHRVLGYVGGNHERHIRPTMGRSAGSLIASLLRIPYSEGQQSIDIHFGEWKPFKIDLWHGGGAARTDGAQLMMLTRWAKATDGDLCLVAHLHGAVVKPLWRRQRNVKGKALGLKKYYACMSSSFMEFWSTYAEIAGLEPSDVCMARCIVEKNGKFEVTVR